jgi:hypothetical protein
LRADVSRTPTPTKNFNTLKTSLQRARVVEHKEKVCTKFAYNPQDEDLHNLLTNYNPQDEDVQNLLATLKMN